MAFDIPFEGIQQRPFKVGPVGLARFSGLALTLPELGSFSALYDYDSGTWELHGRSYSVIRIPHPVVVTVAGPRIPLGTCEPTRSGARTGSCAHAPARSRI